MKKLVSLTCGLVVAFVVFAVNAGATVIADWTFESSYTSITGSGSDLGPLSPETGSGSASGHHANSASVWSAPVGDGSAKSFSVNNWSVGDYFQFQVNASGYQDILLDWDQTSSNTGPRDFVLQYSTDGSSFSTFGSQYTVLGNIASTSPSRSFWSSASYESAYHLSFDLSSVGGTIDNQSSLYFRLVDNSNSSANGGSTASSGTDRVDNFVVSATAIPEPSSIMLVGVGLTSLVMVFRRRRS